MTAGALSRYHDILRGAKEARYLMANRVRFDIDLDDDLETLWKTHSTFLREDGTGGGVSLIDLKIEIADRMLSECCLCERRCGADRRRGEKGHCGVLEPRVASEFLHFGEEPELVPSYTVFFSGCTFNCVYCQNWDISTRPGSGARVDPTTLSRAITDGGGGRTPGTARNTNWVGGDPTSNLKFVLETLRECRANVPQVWNSNMYLTEEAMALLDGVIDVFLTDFKYGNDECAVRLSGIERYSEVVRRNHELARESCEVIIRHLVLPSHIECCTRPVLEWIANNLKDVKVNVMGQYRPCFRAREFADIARPLSSDEFESAIHIAEGLGLDLCE